MDTDNLPGITWMWAEPKQDVVNLCLKLIWINQFAIV